jgi:predicted kinase
LVADIGPAGYCVALALAESNLAIGRIVIADCVNPVAQNRMAWRATADRAKSFLFDIEVICSDLMEHQRRVEARTSEIPGLTPPTWLSVQQHKYEPWLTKRLAVDNALLSPTEALSLIESYLDGNGS